MRNYLLTTVGALFVVFVFVQAFYNRPPLDFPLETFLTIEKGTPLQTIASDFEKRRIVRSAFWLKSFVTLRGGSGGAIAGDYFFKGRASALRIAERLVRGEYGLEETKVVIPEGLTNKEMAAIFARALPKFSAREFLALAAQKEGYLFPDTYQFLPNVSADIVIIAMEKNFNKKMSELESLVQISKKPLKDVVVMASLLEKEARTTDARRRISGILWKRLRLGMPLQVDAVFPYIFEGKLYDLTDGDLMTDSPYNTYKYKGLPPGAISNPGLDALRAAITPIDTQYLYYLSDKEGEMHYAKTHNEHLANRAKYLNL
ncbi:MAG: Aminodeoxychorismate lyase [Parcubacteria group bacterium GW2011_GWA2_47_12]|nr:MAG: Aminodeoxychorismate lyase [Parcubacteria group bacterium GW2011_GWA2_47_12]